MAAKPPPLMAASFPWDRAAVATSLEFSSGGDIDGGTRGCWLVSQWVAGEEGARKKREVMTEGEEVLAAPVTTTPAPVKACLGGEGVAHSVGGRFWKEFEGEALCFRILGLTIFDLGPNSNAEQNFASSVHVLQKFGIQTYSKWAHGIFLPSWVGLVVSSLVRLSKCRGFESRLVHAATHWPAPNP
ncbi:hypothetical protein AHAS_Ahas06G0257000 [Arachis hypogaea]